MSSLWIGTQFICEEASSVFFFKETSPSTGLAWVICFFTCFCRSVRTGIVLTMLSAVCKTFQKRNWIFFIFSTSVYFRYYLVLFLKCSMIKDILSIHWKDFCKLKQLVELMCIQYVNYTDHNKKILELKRLVHPKMKILSLITHPHIVPNP